MFKHSSGNIDLFVELFNICVIRIIQYLIVDIQEISHH